MALVVIFKIKKKQVSCHASRGSELDPLAEMTSAAFPNDLGSNDWKLHCLSQSTVVHNLFSVHQGLLSAGGGDLPG